jgi:acyl-CoA reductase-like NAD-dependent aldehyde dehydrogenase
VTTVRTAAASDVSDPVDSAARVFETADDDPRLACRVLEAAAELLAEQGEELVATAHLQTGPQRRDLLRPGNCLAA